MKREEIQALRSELQQGNNDFLEIVFDKYGQYCIMNLIRKFGCTREDAEDIMVDAVLNFRDKLLAGKISYLSSVRNYLYATCINMKKERDYYLKRRKEKEHEVILYLYSDLDEMTAYKENLLNLSLKGFEQLSQSCQQILRYFYVNRYTMDKIAQKTGLANANSVKVTKARCYKKWLDFVNKSKRS